MLTCQDLLKVKLPHLNGLRNVLTQTLENSNLQPLSENSLSENSIQILHVNGNHWITVSTTTCGTDIAVYDSMHESYTHH